MKKTILVVFVIFTIGCINESIATIEPTPIMLSTQISTATAISLSIDPPPTFTNTIVSSTWTPLPTFPPNEGMKTLQKWLKGVDNCLLPCWAGITPGQSSWEEAKQLLQTMSGFSTINTSENYNCDFGRCNGIGWSLFPQALANGGIYSKLPENKIHLMILEIQEASVDKINLLESTSLEMVLRKYGVPSILLFFTEPDLPGQIFLELTLVYPQRQFVIRYSRYAVLDGENIVSCGPDSYMKLIVADNQDQMKSLDALANAAETKELNFDSWHKSVEEATGMTIDTFYETFSKENAPCIVTPIKVWQP